MRRESRELKVTTGWRLVRPTYLLCLVCLVCLVFSILQHTVNKQLRQMQSRKIGSPRVLIPSSFPLFADFQGQKGESGSPGKNASGRIRFGDTAENCTGSIAGTVRFNTTQKTLQLCDGSAWLPLVTAGKGLTLNNPGRHCLDILNSGEFKVRIRVHVHVENWKLKIVP